MTKKILLAIAFVASVASCTDDYKDWLSPQVVDQPEIVSFGDGSISTVGVIDFNSVTDEFVKVCNITAPTSTNASFTPSYSISLGDNTYEITADGTMSAADLQNYFVSLYGRRPVEREVAATVSMWLSNGVTTVKTATSGEFHIKAIPQAPDLESSYYITGGINGWDNNNTDYELTNGGGDPYENPVFTVTIPAPADGSDVEFKVTPASGIGGDWSKCLVAASTEGRFNFNNDGGNLVIEAIEGTRFYVLTFNMLDQTWSYEALPGIEDTYYLVGTMNGWNINSTEFALTNGGQDPYEQPVFSILLPAEKVDGELKFKVVPKSGLGSWDQCLTAGATEGTFIGRNAGSDIAGEVVEGAIYYRIEFNMLTSTYSITALSFDPYVYFIGATDGWSKAEQRLALTDESGIYTGYLYCADPNGWGNAFKFQKQAGNWDTQINCDTMTGGITGDFIDDGNGDRNFVANAGEGIYYVTLNLAANTLNAVRITNMNLVGDFNGWNAGDDTQQMTWDAENYCFVITSASVNGNGWKFTTNNSWDINLGGNDSVEPSMMIGDLAANGKNLGAVGTTIKLYPTRKTSDKIYCTVE